MTHVAFLRAINVGGRSVVKMTDLKAAFERAGCREVRTFIASGNVLFEAPSRLPAALRARIGTELTTLLGTPPGICYRTLQEIDALIESGPFRDLAADRSLKLYVAFMDREPEPHPRLPIVDAKELVEITAIRAADLLLVSRRKPNGMYGFPNACVESLGVMATSRNWNTVIRVAAFARRSSTKNRPANAGRNPNEREEERVNRGR
jgi:uncharacterized protein (DUF1697 family)